MKNKLAIFAVALGLTFQAKAATFTLAPGLLGGTQLGATLTAGIVSDVTQLPGKSMSGTLVSKVFQNDPNNPNIGGLTFWYQLTLTSIVPTTDLVNRLGLNGFLGQVGLTAAYITGSQTPDPFYTFNADTVGFSWITTGGIAPGQSSSILLVRTKATAFTTANDVVQDGVQGDVQGYAPGVPDGGTTVMLLGGALAGLGVLRKKFIA